MKSEKLQQVLLGQILDQSDNLLCLSAETTPEDIGAVISMIKDRRESDPEEFGTSLADFGKLKIELKGLDHDLSDQFSELLELLDVKSADMRQILLEHGQLMGSSPSPRGRFTNLF